MKRNTLTRLLCIALLACAPAGLVRCGGTAKLGTETGNPPVIDNQKLRLEWTPNGVRLIGDPGAVAPGAEVRLTNTRTGESASAVADSDGSLLLEVPGALSDPYQVRVSAAGRETTQPLSGGSVSDELTTLSCTDLESRLGQIIRSSLASGDTSCSTKEDCVHPGLVSCDQGCGYDAVLSLAGEASARADAEQRTAPICTELERCQRLIPPCDPSLPPVLSCIEGRCVGRDLAELSCLELTAEASQREQAVAVAADRTCTLDQDCSLFYASARCVDNCRYASAVSAEALLQHLDDLTQATEIVCRVFEQQGCPVVATPCPAPPINPRAVCRSNRCELESDNF
jgi:hypothetical protein